MRTAAVLLSLGFAVAGFIVALGVWGVGYCGGLTPDTAAPGTLRHDLCRETSGNLFSALVVAAWLWGAVAPAIGGYFSLRRDSTGPLVCFTVFGALPIGTIAILGEVLPQT